MHQRHFFQVYAKDAQDAASAVVSFLECQERLTENNWWDIVGVVSEAGFTEPVSAESWGCRPPTVRSLGEVREHFAKEFRMMAEAGRGALDYLKSADFGGFNLGDLARGSVAKKMEDVKEGVEALQILKRHLSEEDLERVLAGEDTQDFDVLSDEFAPDEFTELCCASTSLCRVVEQCEDGEGAEFVVEVDIHY